MTVCMPWQSSCASSCPLSFWPMSSAWTMRCMSYWECVAIKRSPSLTTLMLLVRITLPLLPLRALVYVLFVVCLHAEFEVFLLADVDCAHTAPFTTVSLCSCQCAGSALPACNVPRWWHEQFSEGGTSGVQWSQQPPCSVQKAWLLGARYCQQSFQLDT